MDRRPREPLVFAARGPNRGGGCRLLPGCPHVSLAGGLLGFDLNADCHAIDFGRGAANFRAAFCRNGNRSGCWCSDSNLLSWKGLAFGIAVFVVGVVCAAFGVARSAYRYASITLAIVMLVERSASPWLIAVHRFFEVSLGIAVGLLLSALWPERPGKTFIGDTSGGSGSAPR